MAQRRYTLVIEADDEAIDALTVLGDEDGAHTLARELISLLEWEHGETARIIEAVEGDAVNG